MKPSAKRNIIIIISIILLLLAIGTGTYVRNKTPYKEKLYQVYYYKIKFRIPMNLKPKTENIFSAIDKKDYSSVEALVRNNRGVLESERRGITGNPLHYAISLGDERMAALLIAAGSNTDGMLNWAACEGQVEIAKLSIACRKNVKNSYDYWTAPLSFASMYGKPTMVRFLLERGANVDDNDTESITPLHWAAGQGDLDPCPFEILGITNYDKQIIISNKVKAGGYLEVVKILVENGADINRKDDSGRTPLHLAARNGCLSKYRLERFSRRSDETVPEIQEENAGIAKFLIDNGAALELKEKYERTPLVFAIENGNLTVAEYFLKRGAKIYHNKLSPVFDEGERGLDFSTFQAAAAWGMTDVCKAFLNAGFEVDNDSWGTPLSNASSYVKYFDKFSDRENIVKRKIETAGFLISRGSDVNYRDEYKRTALHIAAQEGFYEIIPFLISKGANMEAVDKDGYTPLGNAVKNNDYGSGRADKSALLLMQKGAKPENFPGGIENCFRISILNGNKGTAEALLSRGVDIDSKDSNGNTALHLTVKRNDEDMVKWLLSRKADVNVVNRSGKTPLDYATESDEWRNIKALSKYGAKSGKELKSIEKAR